MLLDLATKVVSTVLFLIVETYLIGLPRAFKLSRLVLKKGNQVSLFPISVAAPVQMGRHLLGSSYDRVETA